MDPILQPGSYVFATVSPTDTSFRERLFKSQHSFEMLFRESEGWTLIADLATVDAIGGLESAFPCKKVTLGVQSSLDAVGFMAAVTTRLATAGLGINPVSGFYHDHLYVFGKHGNGEGALLMMHRFVREGEEDRVVDMIRTMADECKTELSRNSTDK